MPNTRKLQLSFGAGEVDPEMYARIDAVQYQSGLAKIQNWMVDPKGPLKKRPGFGLVASTSNNYRKSRLIPFTYSVDESLVIELGHRTIRFHTNGGAIKSHYPLKFNAAAIDTAADTITFVENHNLTNDDEIAFNVGAGAVPAVLPYGLESGVFYFVIVVDNLTIQVSETHSVPTSTSSLKNVIYINGGSTGAGGIPTFFTLLADRPELNDIIQITGDDESGSWTNEFYTANLWKIYQIGQGHSPHVPGPPAANVGSFTLRNYPNLPWILWHPGAGATRSFQQNEPNPIFSGNVVWPKYLQFRVQSGLPTPISLSGDPQDGSEGLFAIRRSDVPYDWKGTFGASVNRLENELTPLTSMRAKWGFGLVQGQKVRIKQDRHENAPVAPSLNVDAWVDYDPNLSSLETIDESFALRKSLAALGTEPTPGNTINPTTLQAYNVAGSNYSRIHLVAHYHGGDVVYFPRSLVGSYIVEDLAGKIGVSRGSWTSGSEAEYPPLTLDDTYPTNPDANWVLAPVDGSLSIESPYTEDDIFDIEYAQSGDIVTLTHPSHQPRELRRNSATQWSFEEIPLSPSIEPPSGLEVEVNRGAAYQIAGSYIFTPTFPPANVLSGEKFTRLDVAGQPPFTEGDTIYIEWSYWLPLSAGLGYRANGQKNGNPDPTSFPNNTTYREVTDGYYTCGNVDNVQGGAKQASAASNSGSLELFPDMGFQIFFQDTGERAFLKQNLATQYEPLSGLTTPRDACEGLVYIASASAETSQNYKIVSVGSDLQESLASELVTASNILEVPGSSNIITWVDSPGAVKHKIYKEENGIYAFIGSVDVDLTTGVGSFEDNFIGPDLSDTLPIQDNDIGSGYQPRAVANFEQRRCFAGSDNLPRTLFMSRSGTQSAFTYQIPIKSADRVSVQLASREAHTIRHLVSLQDLIILTQQGEWQVTAINSDAIGPETIAIRPQSYIGSNTVRPVVVNNQIVFCANRGGHVRQLGYNATNNGYLTGDLSLRAAHLFNGYELTDLAYSKAPIPKLWFVSTSGRLLCMTYVPEERVLAWQHYVTDGVFESVCAIPEGHYDNIYVVVKRTDSNGDTVRSIERMVAVYDEEREDAVYLDSSLSYNGTNTGPRALEIISSGLYKSGDSVSVKSVEAGVFGLFDIGKEIEFTSGTTKYRLRITAYTSTTQVEATLLADFPSDLHSPASTAIWATAIKLVTGLTHLSNQEISVLADGVMHKDVTVSAEGTITLDAPAVKICAGLKYICEAQTLPVSLETEAGGQGRTKIVNKVYLRVDKSSSLSVGSDSSNLINVDGLSSTSLTTGEFETQIPDSWDQEGQIVIQSTDALPSTILSLTAQISLGD